MREIKIAWQTSKAYRWLLVIAIIYFLFRLAAQVYFAIEPFQSAELGEGQQIASDLQIYVTAARNFSERSDLYLQGSLAILETHYPYSPAFAFLFGPLLLLPLPLLVGLALLLHIGANGLLYAWWVRIFRQHRLTREGQWWAKLLPLYLFFTGFWDDLAYLNIYIIMALLATLLIDALLAEKLGWAVFWLGVVILPIKPHWAFALGLPLLLGHYRFFIKLIVGTLLAYLAVMGVTLLVGGIGYGLAQYQDYLAFLARLSRDFPWRGPEQPFLGYNHSVMQTVLYYFGVSAANMRLATVIKSLLLVPLGLVALNLLRKPVTRHPLQVALALAFAFYVAAFLWLDMVWEITLGMPVFAWLLANLEQRWERSLVWAVFLPYSLLDFWRLLSYLLFGDAILDQGAYVLSDPFIYVPLILVVLLVFYALLLKQLIIFTVKVSENAV